MGLFGRDTKLDREAVFEQLKIDKPKLKIGLRNITATGKMWIIITKIFLITQPTK